MALKNLAMAIKIVILSQILIVGGCVKMRESLYNQIIIWINKDILNHIDTRTFWPRYEGSCMFYIPINVIKKKNNTVKYHTLLIEKNVKSSL